ncbi:MAG: STAS/SEC14 domain-containing protein [Parvularcula sp.]|jgi:hypothetical protein|nr:STAS/SEC14 domain-containing protein [Parvularcula sp.]
MQVERYESQGALCLIFEFTDPLDKRQVEAMAEHVERAMDESEEIRLLLDMIAVREINPSAVASLQATWTSIRSIGPAERYGVVGAPDIAAGAVELVGKVLPLGSKAFSPQERAEAVAWLKQQPPAS